MVSVDDGSRLFKEGFLTQDQLKLFRKYQAEDNYNFLDHSIVHFQVVWKPEIQKSKGYIRKMLEFSWCWKRDAFDTCVKIINNENKYCIIDIIDVHKGGYLHKKGSFFEFEMTLIDLEQLRNIFNDDIAGIIESFIKLYKNE